MKDPHEMTRLELEKEVFESRSKIENLQAKISHQNYVITVYSAFLDEYNSKRLVRDKKDWYS